MHLVLFHPLPCCIIHIHVPIVCVLLVCFHDWHFDNLFGFLVFFFLWGIEMQESKLYGAHFREIPVDAPKSKKITFDNSDDEN